MGSLCLGSTGSLCVIFELAQRIFLEVVLLRSLLRAVSLCHSLYQKAQHSYLLDIIDKVN